jgi:hypothetical protein
VGRRQVMMFECSRSSCGGGGGGGGYGGCPYSPLISQCSDKLTRGFRMNPATCCDSRLSGSILKMRRMTTALLLISHLTIYCRQVCGCAPARVCVHVTRILSVDTAAAPENNGSTPCPIMWSVSIGFPCFNSIFVCQINFPFTSIAKTWAI